jgi:hypothetical protein
MVGKILNLYRASDDTVCIVYHTRIEFRQFVHNIFSDVIEKHDFEKKKDNLQVIEFLNKLGYKIDKFTILGSFDTLKNVAHWYKPLSICTFTDLKNNSNVYFQKPGEPNSVVPDITDNKLPTKTKPKTKPGFKITKKLF